MRDKTSGSLLRLCQIENHDIIGLDFLNQPNNMPDKAIDSVSLECVNQPSNMSTKDATEQGKASKGATEQEIHADIKQERTIEIEAEALGNLLLDEPWKDGEAELGGFSQGIATPEPRYRTRRWSWKRTARQSGNRVREHRVDLAESSTVATRRLNFHWAEEAGHLMPLCLMTVLS